MSEGQPNAPRTPGPVAGQAVTEAHEGVLRHPIHAAEREAKELRDTVAKGESGLTPALLAGAWVTFLIPLVAIVVGVALGVAYLVTRGDGSGGIATGPAKGPGTGQSTGQAGETAPPTTTTPTVAAGREDFAANCSTCHGATGRGGNGGPDLSAIPSAKQLSVVVRQVTSGGGGMPAFSGTLAQQQIDDVAAYVVQNITSNR